jgi:hypothetical protein
MDNNKIKLRMKDEILLIPNTDLFEFRLMKGELILNEFEVEEFILVEFLEDCLGLEIKREDYF